MNDLARQCSTTHTCDDDLDLVECGGLLGTEEQGAYQTAGRSCQSYAENMRAVFLWRDRGSEGPAVIAEKYAHPVTSEGLIFTHP